MANAASLEAIACIVSLCLVACFADAAPPQLVALFPLMLAMLVVMAASPACAAGPHVVWTFAMATTLLFAAR